MADQTQMEPPEAEYEWSADRDVEDVIAGLDLSTLTPTEDIENLDQSNQGSECSSREGASVDGSEGNRADTASLSSEQSEQKSVTSDLSGLDNVWMEDTATGQLEPIKDKFASHPEPKPTRKKSITKNPFKYLQRKLSKGEMVPLSIPDTDLSQIRVDSLPQQFVTKYLGCLPTSGVQGLKHIRKPVDTLVRRVTESDKKKDLPLVQLTVWGKGVQATLHPKTTSRDFEPHVMPVEFISYAVQDTKYYKIFAFINVTEVTSNTQKVECHAYVCDSAATARKLTLSVAKAFQLYAGKLGGGRFEFKVDLRTPDEIKREKMEKRKSRKGSDFEA
ncbi:uncharacterized protein LOC135498136 [Lineus longissimus]|uniref:uncharacterized protein LOC135498136 n=1 Tax=Lineus longissimus TaxID=88925 RepID=UPI00315D32FF